VLLPLAWWAQHTKSPLSSCHPVRCLPPSSASCAGGQVTRRRSSADPQNPDAPAALTPVAHPPLARPVPPPPSPRFAKEGAAREPPEDGRQQKQGSLHRPSPHKRRRGTSSATQIDEALLFRHRRRSRAGGPAPHFSAPLHSMPVASL
jgi:hypothetical protein